MSRFVTSATVLDKPAWAARPQTLATLRDRAVLRRNIRDLCEGEHYKVLVELAQSHHNFGKIVNSNGQLNTLVAAFNVIDLAPDMHAAVLFGNNASVSTAEGFDAQGERLAAITSESHFEAMLMRAGAQAVVDGEAPLRVTRDESGQVIIKRDSIDTCLPVGDELPNMQPSVWERRWTIERKQGTKKVSYLRVERHRVIAGAGIVEQEVYVGSDRYADLTRLKRVPLRDALGEDAPADMTETGLDRNTIVRLVRRFDRWNMPRMLLGKADIRLFDTHAAAFSRLARTMEQHGKAKLRGPESLIGEDGKVDVSKDFFVDEDKLIEYLVPQFNFADMTTWLMKTVQFVLTQLQMSPALLGVKLEGGAMPDTYDKLRLESTHTLTAAKTAQKFCEPALEELLYVASAMDSATPFAGYAIGEVDVQLNPEIPADMIDRARAWAEIKREGMADELFVLQMLWGDGAAAGIAERLKEEREAASARAQREIFGSFAGGAA